MLTAQLNKTRPTETKGRLHEVYVPIHFQCNNLHGSNHIKFLKQRENHSRVHTGKLGKKREHKRLQRGGWFANRVVNPWKNLPTSWSKHCLDATDKYKLESLYGPRPNKPAVAKRTL